MEAALLVKKLRSEFAGPFELSLGIGTCAAITGSSGSGKSLFLRMIDVRPGVAKAGHVRVRGVGVVDRQSDRTLRRKQTKRGRSPGGSSWASRRSSGRPDCAALHR